MSRIVVAISGSGTNLQALIDAQPFSQETPGQIVHVISNRKAAYGIVRAQSAEPSIPTSIFSLQPYLKNNPDKKRADYDVELADNILKHEPDLVVLAGFMHILSPEFLAKFESPRKVRIINLHPSLPGLFPGINAIERAYEAFTKNELPNDTTGLMIHEVVEEIDAGEPLIVKEIKINQGETLDEFQERFHKLEHVAIVEGVQKALKQLGQQQTQ